MICSDGACEAGSCQSRRCKAVDAPMANALDFPFSACLAQIAIDPHNTANSFDCRDRGEAANMQSLTLRRLAATQRSTLSRTRRGLSTLAHSKATATVGAGSRRLALASSSLVLLVGLAAYVDGLSRPAWILKEVHADAPPTEAELQISKSMDRSMFSCVSHAAYCSQRGSFYGHRLPG
jgi:hypothetical protein